MDDKQQAKRLVCKRPWWWWLPLLLLPLALMFAGNWRVQNDLVGKTKRSLKVIGLSSVKASGQDITLRGPASAREAAIAAARAIKGVRNVKYIVDDNAPFNPPATTVPTTTAPTTTTPPTTTAAPTTTVAPTTTQATTTTVAAPTGPTLNAVATYDGTKVVLTGTMATEAQHASIVNAAKAAFGDANVDDQITVNGSGESPELDAAVTNLAGTFAAMKTNLTTGVATLANTTLTMSGSAPADSAKAAVDQAVTGVSGTSTVTADPPKTADALEANLNKLNSLKGITFETGSDVIKAESKPTLDEAAATLTEFFATSSVEKVEIGGHTDNVGNDASNQRLSERRANAVLTYLKAKGVDATRLTAVGYGKTKPIADNNTAAGKAANRRIEFTVSGS